MKRQSLTTLPQASMNTFLQLMERTFFLNGSGPSQHDVAYQPDAEKYKSRTKRRLGNEQLPKELSEGFPVKLHSLLA